MYQIIGVRRSLSLFALGCALAFSLWARLSPPSDPSNLWAWWKIASAAAANFALLVTVVGQTAFFPLICRLPLVRDWFPAVEGTWVAELESNWPEIQRRAEPTAKPVKIAPVKATVKFRARLFSIRMNLESNDRYSTSKTIFVRASRDEEDGSVQFHYIYRNTTLKPKPTDSSGHSGAGCLTLHGKAGELWMEGVYWTDRNWHRGLNTAGKITLQRA